MVTIYDSSLDFGYGTVLSTCTNVLRMSPGTVDEIPRWCYCVLDLRALYYQVETELLGLSQPIV